MGSDTTVIYHVADLGDHPADERGVHLHGEDHFLPGGSSQRVLDPLYFDTKRLPLLWGEAQRDKREHLHVAIDDNSRFLIADIFPDKGQYSSAMHLEEVIEFSPFAIEETYSDNGSAYRGRKSA